MYRLFFNALLGRDSATSIGSPRRQRFVVHKREINQVLQQGPERLAQGRPVSDLVDWHLIAGGNPGVSAVQRRRRSWGCFLIMIELSYTLRPRRFDVALILNLND